MNPGLPIADNVLDFLVFLLVGIIVSAFFDLQRAMRKAVRKNGGKNYTLSVCLQDLLFSAGSFLFVLLVIYRVNDGIVRSYIVAGFAGGVVLYFWVISRVMGRVLFALFYSVLFVLRKIITLPRNLLKKFSKK